MSQRTSFRLIRMNAMSMNLKKINSHSGLPYQGMAHLLRVQFFEFKKWMCVFEQEEPELFSKNQYYLTEN